MEKLRQGKAEQLAQSFAGWSQQNRDPAPHLLCPNLIPTPVHCPGTPVRAPVAPRPGFSLATRGIFPTSITCGMQVRRVGGRGAGGEALSPRATNFHGKFHRYQQGSRSTNHLGPCLFSCLLSALSLPIGKANSLPLRPAHPRSVPLLSPSWKKKKAVASINPTPGCETSPWGSCRDGEFKAKIGLKSRKQPAPVVWWDRSRASILLQRSTPVGADPAPMERFWGSSQPVPVVPMPVFWDTSSWWWQQRGDPAPFSFWGRSRTTPCGAAPLSPHPGELLAWHQHPSSASLQLGMKTWNTDPPQSQKNTKTPLGAPHPCGFHHKDPAQKPQGSTARARGSALQWSAGNKGRSGGRERPFPAPGTLNKPQRPLSLCQPRRSAGV